MLFNFLFANFQMSSHCLFVLINSLLSNLTSENKINITPKLIQVLAVKIINKMPSVSMPPNSVKYFYTKNDKQAAFNFSFKNQYSYNDEMTTLQQNESTRVVVVVDLCMSIFKQFFYFSFRFSKTHVRTLDPCQRVHNKHNRGRCYKHIGTEIRTRLHNFDDQFEVLNKHRDYRENFFHIQVMELLSSRR